MAQDVVATEFIPPFANTAVDGFAVRAADVAHVPIELRVIGTCAAGDGTEWHVGAGEALRIMTGAPMPTGADAVVIDLEDAVPPAEKAAALEIEFRDGRLLVGGRAGKRAKGDGESGQGSLF